jgi:hypothetical protein
MDFLGSIKATVDPPGIDLDQWCRVISAHPNLAAVSPVVGINPLTKAPYTYRPHPGDVRVVVAGKDVGSMNWALDGSHHIDVWGEAGTVDGVATDVAAQLGGAYVRGR